jgi:chorismate-pyruvate lyase
LDKSRNRDSQKVRQTASAKLRHGDITSEDQKQGETRAVSVIDLKITDLHRPLDDEICLSLFQKVLLTTDGSVTELLSMYTGEPIRAEKIEQSIKYGLTPAGLDCPGRTPLLHRKIMLKGPKKGYVFAESFFVLERLSTSIQNKLLQTETPIGALWRQEKVEMYREIIEAKLEVCGRTALHFDLPADTRLLSRTYVVFQGGQALGAITEKFPLAYFR